MIELKIEDKSGNILKNGDTIRWVDLISHYDELEYGRKLYTGVTVKCTTQKVEPQHEYDENGYCFIDYGKYYDREGLLEIFNLPTNISDDEFKEYIVDYICDELNVNVYSEEGFYHLINGFEIMNHE